jgi:hypothetical protein
MMHPILQLVVKVSKSLQSLELNLLSATAGVKSLRSALAAMRNDEYFQELYKTVSEICEKHDTSILAVKKTTKLTCRVDDIQIPSIFRNQNVRI